MMANTSSGCYLNPPSPLTIISFIQTLHEKENSYRRTQLGMVFGFNSGQRLKNMAAI